MKKTLLAGLALSSAFFFASCQATHEENKVVNDSTAVLTTDPATTTTTTSTTKTIVNDEKGNPYGTIYNTDGTVKVMGKGYKMDDKGNPYGTTYKTDGTVDVMGVEVYPDGNTTNGAAQGTTITLDGKVNDRDRDGKVGTAEVKEEVKQGANAVGNAVQKGANEVKGEWKDLKSGQDNH